MSTTAGEMRMSRRAMIAGSMAAAATGPALAGAPGESGTVIELRQYKIVRGRRDAFVKLFEREFVDSQEQLGMRLIGQFRDLDDPERFTWIREFASMDTRAAPLTTFYTGPVWKAHREEANPMLDDNDNVLLLKPSGPGLGFGPLARRDRPPPNSAKIVVATIHYLWKRPAEGFSSFFENSGRRVLEGAGAPVLGTYVAEERPNDFPRLPVRQGEKVFVWFTRVDGMDAYERAMTAMRGNASRRRGGDPLLPDFEERPAQVLRLAPTARSRLK